MTVIDLPSPPSVNNLFPTGKHGKRYPSPEYRAWRTAAGWTLLGHRPIKIKGPVALKYEFRKGRVDLGNLEKAVTDLLVEHGVIEGDGPGIVVDIHLAFADVAGARVTVSPA